MITLGSLFDGIGGFPLAAQRVGITPVWASEIEPFPLRVTALRFPEMAQLGDITMLNGTVVPPVDIVTGGSPCQDLSIAGARAGLVGERSGLFLEQIRLIREMREVDQHRERSTEFIRPRFMVWENVPYALKCIRHVLPHHESWANKLSCPLSMLIHLPHFSYQSDLF